MSQLQVAESKAKQSISGSEDEKSRNESTRLKMRHGFQNTLTPRWP
jgi:hypothetical protein